MSYYTSSLDKEAVAYVFDTADRYDNNYQYDGGASFDPINLPFDTCYAANVFRAKAADYEDLTAASFYSETAGGDYSIYVYVSDTPMGANPDSGTLKAAEHGKIPHAGYHTVDLSSPVILKRGQYFSIVLTIHNGNEKKVNIAREMGQNNPNADLKTTVAIQPGQSFFRVADEEWDDIYRPNNSGLKGNLCIKAFTKNRAVPPAGETDDLPETGDNAPLALWLAMILLGTLCLGALALRRSR